MQRRRLFILIIKKALLLLFFMQGPMLYAQNFRYFSGKVVSAQTKQALESTILKVNGAPYVIDKKAEFAIYVIPHDTITFHHLGYTPFEIIIFDTTASADLPSVIALQVEKITLEELIVKSNVLTEEMQRNAQRHVQQAVERALQQKNDDRNPDPNHYRERERYSGVSTSQMFGADLVQMVGLLKKSKKEVPKAPTTKVISYEEYRSSLRTKEKKDSTPIVN